jgi:hypothetical protein
LWGATAEAGLITLLIFGLVAGTALAAKGGKPGGGNSSSSLSLRMVDPTDTVVNYGDQVTFDVATTATDRPDVNVRCYQGEDFVYDGWAGFYPEAWFGQTFTLSSSSWNDGGADCTARLVMWGRNGRERTLATLGFYVTP